MSKIAEYLTKDEVTAIYHAVKFASCNNQTSEQAFLAVRGKVTDKFTDGSCKRFFKAFEAMQGGDMYKQPMGPEPTDWFLGLFEKEELKQALDALEEHIKHRQKFPSSCKMEIYWEIHKKYSKILNSTHN